MFIIFYEEIILKKIETIEISGISLGIAFLLIFIVMLLFAAMAIKSSELAKKHNKQKLKQQYS